MKKYTDITVKTNKSKSIWSCESSMTLIEWRNYLEQVLYEKVIEVRGMVSEAEYNGYPN